MKALITLLFILCSFSAFAAEEHEKQWIPLGCAQDTDMSSAQDLPSIPSGATRAEWHAEAAPFRWRDDGTDPTTSVGMRQPAGSEFTREFTGVLGKVRIIEENTSTILNICYYK